MHWNNHEPNTIDLASQASYLQNTTTYAIGAMDRVPDGGEGWRNDITPDLESLGVTVFNPCNKPIADPRVIESPETRAHIKQLKREGRYEALRDQYGSIRTVDLRMVDRADFIIAYIDLDVHPCGTYEELFTGNRQKKPVLVWCPQGKANAPDWLFFSLPHQHIFGNWPDLFNHLKLVNKRGDDGSNRWVFFQQKV